MKWEKCTAGQLLTGGDYLLRLDGDYRLSFVFDGERLGVLPPVSSLNRDGRKEQLSGIRCVEMSDGTPARLVLEADSSLWEARRFVWEFFPDRAEYSHTARGRGRAEKCFFFSRGEATAYGYEGAGDEKGNFWPDTDRFWTPAAGWETPAEYDVKMSAGAGLWRQNALFSPGPLLYAFHRDRGFLGIGLGCPPEDYIFPEFVFTGVAFGGGALYVDYQGYRAVEGTFASPVAALHFGYDRYDILKQHIRWVDGKGFGVPFSYENAPWHREPIFCGWAEQTPLALRLGVPAGSCCTQENYERWIGECEEIGLPFGTLVLDDKWQKHYGMFDIDREKWPDLPGFIAKQHGKGRHVLLWVPAYHTEGVPEDWCIRDENGKPRMANSHCPAYIDYVRRQMACLMTEVGADGLKVDWIGETPAPGWDLQGARPGIAFIRDFQKLVYDACHDAKADAMIETQTPHPVMRDTSDVLRLNDLYFSVRKVVELMKDRARISHIAGWQVLDCDNATSTTVREWFAYMQAQVDIGVPSLYALTCTEATREPIPREMLTYVAALWRKYRDENCHEA